MAEPVTILYTNWRGETAVRRILIDAIAYGNEALGLAYGRNEWHPEEQWLLSATDADKGERRAFAMAGIKAWGQAAVDAALASPRADSDERTAGEALKEACKPWEHYTGEPPDDGSPLSGVFVAGMVYTERLLAKLLDVTHYEGGDGSEDFDADAIQTLRNILTGARLWDADENRPVSATPAQPAGAVPDSLREAASALLSACMADMGPLDEMDRDDEPVGMSGFGVGTAVTFGHLRRLERALASHPAGQSAGSGAEDRIGLKGISADLDSKRCLKLHFDHVVSDADRQVIIDAFNALARERLPAPDSTRTGQGEADKLVRLLAAVSDRLRDNPPNGLVEGDLYVAAKNEGPDSGWRYVPTGLTVGDLDEARTLLAARPAAPEARGAWSFDMEAAPRDGSDVEVVNDRGQFIAQFDRSWGRSYADAGWWMVSDGKDTERPLRGDEPFAWRIPTKAPAPPASSGQGGR